MTYPSGQRVELTYTNGQVTEISANGAALLGDIEYRPFGPARAWVWGDGTRYNRQFDLDGRMRAYDLGGGRARLLNYDLRDCGRRSQSHCTGHITDYVDTDPSHDQAGKARGRLCSR